MHRGRESLAIGRAADGDAPPRGGGKKGESNGGVKESLHESASNQKLLRGVYREQVYQGRIPQRLHCGSSTVKRNQRAFNLAGIARIQAYENHFASMIRGLSTKALPEHLAGGSSRSALIRKYVACYGSASVEL
jgi:hypothetical protein